MIEFKSNTPRFEQVFQYTLRTKLNTRFEYSKRDILPSKMKVTRRITYKKNKEGKYTTPDEMLVITSWSAPQYQPYLKAKGKNAKKQMTIKHNYDIYLAIQTTNDGIFSWNNSKIIWRVGSYKKWQSKPSQKYIKSIYTETREKLYNKYKKKYKTEKEIKAHVKEDCDKIRKNAKYLDVGDYNSRVNGINGDNYYRDYFIQKQYNCLYGNCFYKQSYKGVDYPFFCKHMLALCAFLLKKGIVKLR